jgi:predicted HD phosphohydrolase
MPTRTPVPTTGSPSGPAASFQTSTGAGSAQDGSGPTGSGSNGERAIPLACARPTAFAPIPDDGLRADYTSTSGTDTEDWLVQGVSSALLQTTMPDVLINLLRGLGSMHLGYPINLLDHSLQTATRARRDGASDDVVLAALFHHIGTALTVEGQAEVGAAIARGYVSEDAYRIIRHHPEYAWKHHGVQIDRPTDQRDRYAGQSFHPDAVRLADDWDRVSYEPDYPSLPLSDFEPLIRARFTSLTSDLFSTQRDCI